MIENTDSHKYLGVIFYKAGTLLLPRITVQNKQTTRSARALR